MNGIINESQKISDCEEMIMKVLWDAGEDLDLIQVTEQVRIRYGKVWKLQTVATFMTRLKNKGWIDIYRIGRYSHYHPLVSLETYREVKMAELYDLFAKVDKEDKVYLVKELAEKVAGKME